MKSGALILAAGALSSIVVACGGEPSADPAEATSPITVTERAALPACDASMETRVAYATNEDAVVVCVAGAWRDLKGADGARGAAGPQGAAGSDGAAGSKGDTGSKGETGQHGDAGAKSLVDLVSEPPGINCGLGGTRIVSGVDENGDGALDASEISDTAYVCNARPTARRVFVTSASFNGNLGGVAGADQKCQAAADAVPALQGATFRAWISTEAESPAQRFSRDAPLGFMRTDGVKIATSWEDLVDGTLLAPIKVTEHGATIVYPHAWTDTTASGVRADKMHCSGWTSVTGSGALGQGWSTNGFWAGPVQGSWTYTSCDDQARLYCFEQ